MMASRTTRLLWWRRTSTSRQGRLLSTLPHVSPKVQELVTKMVALSEDELNLVGLVLSERMGIPIPDFDAAPVMVEEEIQEEAPVVEKTVFDLKLLAFDAKNKIKVIKEVRAIAGLGLKEAKEMVEGAPTIIQKGLKKEQAEELQTKLEEIGATVQVV